MSSTGATVDRLSSLPDAGLSHILSRMPTKLVVQTSILSKRWRYSWMLVKSLDFDELYAIHDLDCLCKFIDRALELRKASQVKLFRLRLSYKTYKLPFGNKRKALPESSMLKWISEAIGLHVCELDIRYRKQELPLSLFTCKTLTKLNLSVGYVGLKFPSFVNLPCLKFLVIDIFRKPPPNTFEFIHGCPILESLTLYVVWHNDDEEYNFNIPTLKILNLHNMKRSSVINKVVLNVPKLEHLFVGGTVCSLFVMEDLPPFIEVKVSFSWFVDHPWLELLKGISGARSLSLVMPHKVPFLLPPLMFPNLKQLKLEEFICPKGLLLIFQLLETFSELEHICIEESYQECSGSSCMEQEDFSWIAPQSVPTCMLKNLKTMKFENFKGRKSDIEFLEYMLGNTEVLKTLTIMCKGLCQEKEMRVCGMLMEFPRASVHCEIHFVGKWF